MSPDRPNQNLPRSIRRSTKALALLVLALSTFSPPAAARELRFGRLTPADGLSQFSVNALLQDRQGYLWFGTQDGLNRYDGYSIEVFKADPAIL